jgi:UDP-N-acetylglucosamine pyrophosphorylase
MANFYDQAEQHFPDEFETHFAAKMRAQGVPGPSIRAFRKSFEDFATDRATLRVIRETDIDPITELPRFVPGQGQIDPKLLDQTVVLKLNGGLGTGMGLEGPKSLLRIKDDLTFLDVIARQILHERGRHRTSLRLILMNSFSTTKETTDFLKRYPELGSAAEWQLMQSMAPKVDCSTAKPVQWTKDPEQEWCPPGHGDIYPSLVSSGWLDRLLGEGVKFMFISNSDNLGATLDPDLLGYFAGSGLSFLMEVAERTSSDKKGGHLARRVKDGRLLLRESAQTPKEAEAQFQDIQRHRYFNTNNLWIQLEDLKQRLDEEGGFLPLPVIRNQKTVDPRDSNSPAVYQLETAMGAAIELFERAGAIVVPRSRFAPVKTTSDLFTVRSDVYSLTPEWQMVLAPARKGVPPTVSLDGKHYKFVDQLDNKTKDGVPSLVECDELTVVGPVSFGRGIRFRGKVRVTNRGSETRRLGDGEYRDQEVDL